MCESLGDEGDQIWMHGLWWEGRQADSELCFAIITSSFFFFLFNLLCLSRSKLSIASFWFFLSLPTFRHQTLHASPLTLSIENSGRCLCPF